MPDEPAPSGLRATLLRAATWTTANPQRGKRVQIVAAVLAFQGAAFVMVAPKLVIQHPVFYWVGLVLLAAGAFLFLAPSIESTLSPKGALSQRKATSTKSRPLPLTLADQLMARVTRNGRLTKFVPLLGAAVVVFDLLYNTFLTTSTKLLSNDFAVLGLGAALLAYPFFPRTLARERNFLVIFFGALSLIFGIPLLALRLGHDASPSVDAYTATLLTPQLAWLLQGLGMNAIPVGNDLYYPDLTRLDSAGFPYQDSVHIATQCSGLYSMAIFIAAFIALVLTDYSRLTWRVAGLLAAGVALAYIANLLRMVVIVEAGHHYGGPALLWTHANLGDVIFLAWVAPFLWLSYRVLDPSDSEREELEHDRFEAAMRAQGIDPSSVGEKDWFCATCFTKVEAPEGEGPEACPACGAALG